MRKKGFEPSQALSYWSLNPARLTTPALPHAFNKNYLYKKLYKSLKITNGGDGLNRLETPGLIPNPEVKLPMLMAVVTCKLPNHQAVFHFLQII